MRSGDVGGQLFDHAFAPGRRFNLAADVLADAPVKLDQRRVDGGDGPRPRGVDQPKDFVEVGLRRGIRGDLPGKALFRVLLGVLCSCRLLGLGQQFIQVVVDAGRLEVRLLLEGRAAIPNSRSCPGR